MYDPGWAYAGMAAVLFLVFDAFWTTLTVRGAGPLSRVIAGITGRVTMRGPAWMAENASILALIATFLAWSLLLWVAWSAIFCGAIDAVQVSSSSAPANLVERVYFAGFTLTTLGIGDLVPGKGVWQLATVVAAATGFGMLTLFVTYTFSVITALNQRRSIGAAVGHLGLHPARIIALQRGGGGQALATRLLSLTDLIEKSAMQAGAYPVIEYSHVAHPNRSFANAIVSLGEVTFLLEFVVDQQQTLPRVVWMPLRRAVDFLIREGRMSHVAGDGAPPPPDLTAIGEASIGIRENVHCCYAVEEVRQKRARWAAWLRWHGREWQF